MSDAGLTLLTSDSRPKYANDALAVLAVPFGLSYQFRYYQSYVPTTLKHHLDNNEFKPCKALIAYREEKCCAAGDQAIVPLRWATLLKVEKIGDFYTFTFECRGYPRLSGGGFPPNRQALVALAAQYQADYKDDWKMPVHVGVPRFAVNGDSADRDTWMGLAATLALSPPFSETHFLRVGSFSRPGGKEHNTDPDGWRTMVQGQYAHVAVDYFAANYGNHDAKLIVAGDSTILRVASRAELQLDSRYDSLRVWVQAGAVPGSTRTELEVRTVDSRAGAPQTAIRLPVLVTRSWRKMAIQVVATAAAAIAVAAPGLLPEGDYFSLKLVLAALGAVVLAAAGLLGGAS